MADERALRLERGETERDAGREPGAGSTARIGDRPGETTPDVPGEAPSDAPAELAAGVRPVDVQGSALSDEEVAEFRRRVAGGIYDSREVADEVARRMLESGDI